MKKLIPYAVLAVLAGSIAFYFYRQSGLQAIEVFFSEPQCQEYAYNRPVTEQDGDIRGAKFGHAYCSRPDLEGEASVPVTARLLEILKDNRFDIQHIDIAAYLFSYDVFVDAVCQRAQQDEFTVRITKQRTAREFVTSFVMSRLDRCMGKRLEIVDVGCDVFHAACKNDGVKTMHTKMVMLEGTYRGKAVSYILAGSANFSQKLELNFDDLILIKAPQESYLVHYHRCMLETMKWAEHIAAIYRNATGEEQHPFFERCMKDYSVHTNDRITPYFIPLYSDEFRRDLLNAIDTATDIKLSLHMLGDVDIQTSLTRAMDRGAAVKIVVADKWYYLMEDDDFTRKNDFWWGKNDVKQFRTILKPLLESRANVRFLETNFDRGPFQANTIHHRFFIIKNANESVVFTGSSHMKPGVFRRNYENMYAIRDPHAVTEYDMYFDRLYARSLSEADMPKSYVRTRYAIENPWAPKP